MHRLNIVVEHLKIATNLTSASASPNIISKKTSGKVLRKGRLEGRVAVVTGGGIGIGRGICLRLCAEGCNVVVADINSDLGKTTVEKVTTAGGSAVFQLMDTTKEETVKITMQRAVDEFGRLDILVNNAACFVFGHLLGAGNGSGDGTDRDITPEDWRKVFDVNVIGYANCIKHAIPHMRKNEVSSLNYDINEGEGTNIIHAGYRGSIVNMGSISSFIAQPEFIPYNCSKGAISQLTKCAAMDLAPEKIRVNSIFPGSVESPGAYNHMKLLGKNVKEGREYFGSFNLLNRQGAPEEIGNGVVFLASDDSAFMTGASIVMDGGGSI